MKIKSLTVAAMILVLACVAIVNAQGRQRGRRPAKPTPKSAPNESALWIEAALLYNSGDVKPVARVTFFLMDDEIVSVLQKAKLAEADRGEAKYTVLRLLVEGDRRASEAIAAHVVKSVDTDFNGRAKFPPVAPGTYYVFGMSEVTSAFWSVKVVLVAGDNNLILDNKNIGFR